VDVKTGPELGFEPGALGRHDLIGIGNGKNLIHGDGGETKGRGSLTRFYFFLQNLGSVDSSHKIKPGIRPWILHQKLGSKETILKSGGIQTGYRIRFWIGFPC
jgi:hypothetical protein